MPSDRYDFCDAPLRYSSLPRRVSCHLLGPAAGPCVAPELHPTVDSSDYKRRLPAWAICEKRHVRGAARVVCIVAAGKARVRITHSLLLSRRRPPINVEEGEYKEAEAAEATVNSVVVQMEVEMVAESLKMG